MGSPLGCNKVELGVILEAELRGHRSCTKNADTSCGYPVGGYPNSPTSNRQGADVLAGFSGERNVNTCLVYHINKSLRIVSREIFKHLDLITIREDDLYQIDALIRGKDMSDQLFPGRKVAIHEEEVRLASERQP